MAKEGIKGVENQHKHYIEICNIVDGDVSAEVIAEGDYTIEDTVVVLTDREGKDIPVNMIQKWPVKKAMTNYCLLYTSCTAGVVYSRYDSVMIRKRESKKPGLIKQTRLNLVL